MRSIPPRKVVKELIFFAKREFREKKPLAVQVLRRKSEQIYTIGGPLKEFSMKRVEGAFYLLVVEYKEEYRIYYYSKEGKLLEAKNLEKNLKLQHEIQKSTIREFQLGKR
ncbi:MAG: hypothetical protein ACFFE5_00915 [Candidatus Thorarchaeota archaeon]